MPAPALGAYASTSPLVWKRGLCTTATPPKDCLVNFCPALPMYMVRVPSRGMLCTPEPIQDCEDTHVMGVPKPGGATTHALLLVLHITPIGGVLPRKKRLEFGLNLLCKHRALLIRLHGVERIP